MNRMTTRLERLGEFSRGEPAAGESVENQSDTYLIPSLCQWVEGKWVTAARGTTITAKIVG